MRSPFYFRQSNDYVPGSALRPQHSALGCTATFFRIPARQDPKIDKVLLRGGRFLRNV
jgi:hypothetical protein